MSAARPSEALYPISYSFLQKAKGAKVFCPTLILSECAAAIARPTGDSIHSRKLVSLIRHFPGMTLVALDKSIAAHAAEIAIENRLRGADAVYVAVAEDFDSVLISLDEEMLKRSVETVLTMSPERWLKTLSDDIVWK